METMIVGAGFAGLITACKIKDADIYEVGPRKENHRALLRFRDEAVSIATGIPFRRVLVHKEISFQQGCVSRCFIGMANQYAFKVTGRYINDRSIWNLDPAERYIAPPDFYDQLCDMHSDRIKWERSISTVNRGQKESNIVSTIPLPTMLKACGLPAPECEFVNSPINVVRYALPEGTDLYQTLYFPDLNFRCFRASITGSTLIVEQVTRHPLTDVCEASSDWAYETEHDELGYIIGAFGLHIHEDKITFSERTSQKFGKIVPIPRETREALLFELTREFNVYSIGRFATWRNILLDDVVKDVEMVQRLMSSTSYGRDLQWVTNSK